MINVEEKDGEPTLCRVGSTRSEGVPALGTRSSRINRVEQMITTCVLKVLKNA